MRDLPQVHIIGRGIIGLAIAFRLCRAGRRVVLYGPAHRNGTASLAAVGVSAVKGINNARRPLFAAKLAGHRRLKEWLQQIQENSGISIQYDLDGAFEPFMDMTGYEGIRDRVYHRNFTGCFDFEVLSAADSRSKSKIPLGSAGAFLYPRDGWFDPIGTMAAISEYLKRNGCILVEEAVAKILPATKVGGPGQSVQVAIETERASYLADDVVLAAGIFSNEILYNSKILDAHPSLKQEAVYGETLLGPCPRELNSTVISRKLSLGAKAGSFRFGSSSENLPSPADGIPRQLVHSTPRFRVDLLTELPKVSPFLVPPDQITTIGGIRGRVKDRSPVIGRVRLPRSDKSILVALGFYKNGLQLADLAAEAIENDLTSNLRQDLSPSTSAFPRLFAHFLPSRFAALGSS